MTPSRRSWRGLEESIAGEVVLPGSPGYDLARKPAVARFHDVLPQAVVRCAAPADVAEVVSFAAQAGLPVAPRSGGHCFAGGSSTTGVVIDVTPMRTVTVSAGLATVGAGTRLTDLYDALAEHDLTIPAGCGPAVGIAGLTLGGGLGILGRRHGLTCDHLLSGEVVLPRGLIVGCDANHDADLFWALRGAGGGRFGVVTSFTFGTLPAPPATTFQLRWPYTRARPVIEAWQGWAPNAPDELAASLLIAADGVEPPEVTVSGTMLGSASDTVRLLDQLVARIGSDPISYEHAYRSHHDTKRYLSGLGDPAEDGRHSYSKSEYFRQQLPTSTIEALLAEFLNGRMPGQTRILDFMPWGGAYNRVPTHATAFAHRDELFLLKHEVLVPPGSPDQDSAHHWLSHSWKAVHPWASGGVYPNFPDPALNDWSPAYHGPNRDRLLRIRRQYDLVASS